MVCVDGVLVGLPAAADIVHGGRLVEESECLLEFAVVAVGEECLDGDGVLGLEGVGEGGVVDDECALEVAAEGCDVLDVAAADEGAVLAVEAGGAEGGRVERGHDRVCVEGEGGCEDDELPGVGGCGEEGVDARPLLDEDGVRLAAHVEGDLVVRVGDAGEGRVDERLVEVEDEAGEGGRRRREEGRVGRVGRLEVGELGAEVGYCRGGGGGGRRRREAGAEARYEAAAGRRGRGGGGGRLRGRREDLADRARQRRRRGAAARRGRRLVDRGYYRGRFCHGGEDRAAGAAGGEEEVERRQEEEGQVEEGVGEAGRAQGQNFGGRGRRWERVRRGVDARRGEGKDGRGCGRMGMMGMSINKRK